MSLSVVILTAVATVLGAVSWGRAVLVDEARYVRAVSRLPQSQRVARVAGWSVALAARHRGGWRRGVSPRTGRVLALVTRRTMRDARFGAAWAVGHRWLHRARSRDRRVATVMLVLAATGELVGVARTIRRWLGSSATADPRARAVGRPRAW